MYKFRRIVNSSSSNIVIISSTVSPEFVCIGLRIYNQVKSKQRYHINVEKPFDNNEHESPLYSSPKLPDCHRLEPNCSLCQFEELFQQMEGRMCLAS